MMASVSKPQEEGEGLPRRACQRRWTSPTSSLTGVTPVTFAAVTAADQNNTYYSCMFPGITREPKKSVPGKTDRLHPVSVTSSFWVMYIHLSATRCNRILLVSYNMSDGFKKNEPRKTQHWRMNITFQYYPLKHHLVLETGYFVE